MKQQFAETVLMFPAGDGVVATPKAVKRPDVLDLRQRFEARRDQVKAAATKEVQPPTAEEVRQASALSTAYRNGVEFGTGDAYRRGYRAGTHWGMLCGFFACALLGGLGLIGLTLAIKVTHLW